MARMERITAPPQSARAKTVAAYARISMENDRTPKSLSAQISRYSDLIQSTPGWEYAAHPNPGCSRGLNPPTSRSDRAM